MARRRLALQRRTPLSVVRFLPHRQPMSIDESPILCSRADVSPGRTWSRGFSPSDLRTNRTNEIAKCRTWGRSVRRRPVDRGRHQRRGIAGGRRQLADAGVRRDWRAPRRPLIGASRGDAAHSMARALVSSEGGSGVADLSALALDADDIKALKSCRDGTSFSTPTQICREPTAISIRTLTSDHLPAGWQVPARWQQGRSIASRLQRLAERSTHTMGGTCHALRQISSDGAESIRRERSAA
jgi:hypothetical protein